MFSYFMNDTIVAEGRTRPQARFHRCRAARSGEARHRHGVIALAEALDVFTRVEDDPRVRNLRQILTKPLEVLEIVLADIRSGLHLDAKQIPFFVLDDEIDFPPVLVPVLSNPPLVKTSIAKTWSKSQLGFGLKALKMLVQTEAKALKI